MFWRRSLPNIEQQKRLADALITFGETAIRARNGGAASLQPSVARLALRRVGAALCDDPMQARALARALEGYMAEALATRAASDAEACRKRGEEERARATEIATRYRGIVRSVAEEWLRQPPDWEARVVVAFAQRDDGEIEYVRGPTGREIHRMVSTIVGRLAKEHRFQCSRFDAQQALNVFLETWERPPQAVPERPARSRLTPSNPQGAQPASVVEQEREREIDDA